MLTFALIFVKAVVVEIAVVLAQMRQLCPTGLVVICFTAMHLQLKKKKPISIKNVLEEAAKIINFIKS